MGKIAFIDIEVSGNGKILDLGAIKGDSSFHSAHIADFIDFIGDCDYLCGHNILEHDLKFIRPFLKKDYKIIDTLYLSPLLFPTRPYHRLMKDDKIDSEELNNPLSDAKKAKILYEDEISAFRNLPESRQLLYYDLTSGDAHFHDFYKSADYSPGWRPMFLRKSLSESILTTLSSLVCSNAAIESLVKKYPVEFAYATAVILTRDRNSITPAWVLKNYPAVEKIIYLLRNKNCGKSDCEYCSSAFNPEKALKKWFGYEHFRKFNGEPLQENAVRAAIEGESLLAIFPTGGGKSLTFQLPSLVTGETVRGLTIVISPLQSLMKDQVENLEKKGISDAVYINGLLSPVERRNALERVRNGEASMLYIAPEQLRSKTIEKILMSRTLSRFVIDEAHCFSAWGQDFRIEYLHIADFIKSIQEAKGLENPIPVSCFTATAKPKVISDITDYFYDNLGLRLKRFTTDATRTNLHYTVLYRADKEEKYQTLRELLSESSCPSIVYVTRTKAAEEIAARLVRDGLNARAFHGQMDTRVKVQNQDDFINDRVRIIVATSAFGMGVDKSDVGLVVHFEISDSLENYIQEAGRAGRDVHSEADCYVLFNDDDLNRHFVLLNQTKLTFSEINQIWRAIKGLTQKRDTISISALEVARKAGWDEIRDVETKVKSAIAALENAGYVKRGMNSPRIYATSIVPKNLDEAAEIIRKSDNFAEDEKQDAVRIVKSLISERSRAKAGTTAAESRIDYLSDMLGIEIGKVVRAVEKMQACGILAKDDDMSAYLRPSFSARLDAMLSLESFLITAIESTGTTQYGIKELNENAQSVGIAKSNVKDIRTLLFYWTIKDYIEKKSLSEDYIHIIPKIDTNIFKKKFELRSSLSHFIVERFRNIGVRDVLSNEVFVQFSLVGLMEDFNREISIFNDIKAGIQDVEDTLLYLAKIGIMSIEGGFMVLYNKLQIERLNHDNRSRYRKEDYMNLDAFYRQRIQQIHIVGKYANMMVSDERAALEFVHDYFVMDFKAFVKKYFDSREQGELDRNVSPKKYREIFGSLTESQSAIINDKDSRFIVVPAGPGSGKTYVLVRKLASLILMEDVKSEQLLMLTFSRAAATEFRKRLRDLIGNAAEYVEIRTFHSYCFDLLGRIGSIDDSENVVNKAVNAIMGSQVERSRITKSILVIDEAQDMGEDEFALVRELIRNNDDIRVVAVGDDDQNIYEFRGSDSKYMGMLINDFKATVYNMLDNFRSGSSVINLANTFARTIKYRLKTEAIRAVAEREGKVRIVRHTPCSYGQAVVNDILEQGLPGCTAVLTVTNDDALMISAMLNQRGLKARLIQSNEGFRLFDLAELHDFYAELNSNCSTIIPETVWEHTKNSVESRYSTSESLDIVQTCISAFEKEYPQNRYMSDLFNFLCESEIGDFQNAEKDEIVVSTIHKSKGREFDNVFLVLKDIKQLTDKEKRAIYVGITRAKTNLSIHFDGNVFAEIQGTAIEDDYNSYPEPDEILLHLSHKDLYLDFFKGKSALISKLRSGDALNVIEDRIYTTANGYSQAVARFSEAFRNKLSLLRNRGYDISSAKIRFLLFWHYENPDKTNGASKYLETAIILPEITLTHK